MLWEADFEKKISTLTPEKINAALKRHIDPKKMVTVEAGDFAKPDEAKKPAVVQ